MDGLLIKINDDFIRNLTSRGFGIKGMRVRFFIRDIINESTKKGSRFRTFSTLDSYNSFFYPTLNLKNYLCSAGDFPVIENIELVNKNLSFDNEYKWFNITERRNLIKNVKYDSFRNSFYESEMVRYESLMNQLLDSYISNVNTSIDIRLNSYMDPCYVDAGYVSPFSSEGDYVKYRNIITNQQ